MQRLKGRREGAASSWSVLAHIQRTYKTKGGEKFHKQKNEGIIQTKGEIIYGVHPVLMALEVILMT